MSKPLLATIHVRDPQDESLVATFAIPKADRRRAGLSDEQVSKLYEALRAESLDLPAYEFVYLDGEAVPRYIERWMRHPDYGTSSNARARRVITDSYSDKLRLAMTLCKSDWLPGVPAINLKG